MGKSNRYVEWLRNNIHRDIRREFAWKNLPKIMRFISKIFYLTCKNKFHISNYVREQNFIACMWHGNFLMMPYLYAQVRDKPNMSFITSAHNDGIIIEKYFSSFGLNAIRGSTGIEKGGIKALIVAIRALKNGQDIAVTPDGPRGPYKSIADGILLMGMKSGVGICPCRISPKRYWELNTWDKFCIPKPFTRIDYYVGDPIFLSQNMDIEEARAKLKETMDIIDSL
ncbi:DUF374 domain-containing protein [Helicobacter muridarum]|uniref:DUF374 domain-containing protein n=1 Tax=Helicobacter muridarum TaxID=216 RepID=A0A377PSF6_9HELI|nr:lysophospholipid acyltransferase family protein [Helicobacter muridarum]TLE01067.1 DUF374 domain-containing protein [Helicobacter muridarum]STQ85918.1 lipoprotein [Helicobacter muridarum]